MAKISLFLLTSRIKKDGTHTIKFKIVNGTSATTFSSQFSVKANQWRGGQVIRHPQAMQINTHLLKQLETYQAVLERLNPSRDMKASMISELLRTGFTPSSSFTDYARAFIDKLKANNQHSYAQNMEYTLKWFVSCFGEWVSLKDISYVMLHKFERFLLSKENHQSDTTVYIRMSHLKALLNSAVNEGVVEYKVFPFRNYKMPKKNERDICISKIELQKLRETSFEGVSTKRFTVARDLFMLSFYCAGINLTDLLDAKLDGELLTFVRKKTAERTKGANERVSITIQPEARDIIERYITKDGILDFGYQFQDYAQFRSFITKSLNRIGVMLDFEKRLMFYSARKTFVQFGSELGIPLYILEYSIGQTIKEAKQRPIFNYLKMMRAQADLAIRTIIDYSFEPDNLDTMPIPSWARRGKDI